MKNTRLSLEFMLVSCLFHYWIIKKNWASSKLDHQRHSKIYNIGPHVCSQGLSFIPFIMFPSISFVPIFSLWYNCSPPIYPNMKSPSHPKSVFNASVLLLHAIRVFFLRFGKGGGSAVRESGGPCCWRRRRVVKMDEAATAGDLLLEFSDFHWRISMPCGLRRERSRTVVVGWERHARQLGHRRADSVRHPDGQSQWRGAKKATSSSSDYD